MSEISLSLLSLLLRVLSVLLNLLGLVGVKRRADDLNRTGGRTKDRGVLGNLYWDSDRVGAGLGSAVVFRLAAVGLVTEDGEAGVVQDGGVTQDVEVVLAVVILVLALLEAVTDLAAVGLGAGDVEAGVVQDGGVSQEVGVVLAVVLADALGELALVSTDGTAIGFMTEDVDTGVVGDGGVAQDVEVVIAVVLAVTLTKVALGGTTVCLTAKNAHSGAVEQLGVAKQVEIVLRVVLLVLLGTVDNHGLRAGNGNRVTLLDVGDLARRGSRSCVDQGGQDSRESGSREMHFCCR